MVPRLQEQGGECQSHQGRSELMLRRCYQSEWYRVYCLLTETRPLRRLISRAEGLPIRL